MNKTNNHLLSQNIIFKTNIQSFVTLHHSSIIKYLHLNLRFSVYFKAVSLSNKKIEIKSMQIKNIYQSLPTNIKDQMPAQQTSTTNSSLCLYNNTTTCDQHCQMPQIETLNLTKFMVCFSHHLTTDVQR